MLLVGWQDGHPACKKTERWGAGVVICLERGADLHMVQLMPLPLTVSCFSKVQIGCVMCVLVFWYDIILLAQQCWTDYSLNSISAFNLLVGWQEGHQTRKIPTPLFAIKQCSCVQLCECRRVVCRRRRVI